MHTELAPARHTPAEVIHRVPAAGNCHRECSRCRSHRRTTTTSALSARMHWPVDSAPRAHRDSRHTSSMTRGLSPLPPELGDAFTYAEASARGVTPRRLRHRGLQQPTRGLRLATTDILRQQPDLADSLRHVVAAHSGARGIRLARQAVELIRPGVLSPQESLRRLGFRDAGFPEPELNVHIHDRAGRWLAMGDFVWREQRVVAEYDGDYHFTVEQRRLDQIRRRAMRAAAWGVIELNGTDNHHPQLALRSIGSALGIHR